MCVGLVILVLCWTRQSHSSSVRGSSLSRAEAWGKPGKPGGGYTGPEGLTGASCSVLQVHPNFLQALVSWAMWQHTVVPQYLWGTRGCPNPGGLKSCPKMATYCIDTLHNLLQSLDDSYTLEMLCRQLFCLGNTGKENVFKKRFFWYL